MTNYLIKMTDCAGFHAQSFLYVIVIVKKRLHPLIEGNFYVKARNIDQKNDN